MLCRTFVPVWCGACRKGAEPRDRTCMGRLGAGRKTFSTYSASIYDAHICRLLQDLGTSVMWSLEELDKIQGSNLHDISIGWKDHIKCVLCTHTELCQKRPKSCSKAHFFLRELTGTCLTVVQLFKMQPILRTYPCRSIHTSVIFRSAEVRSSNKSECGL